MQGTLLACFLPRTHIALPMKRRFVLIRWLLSSIRTTGWAPAAVFGFYLVASLVFDAYPLYWWLDSVTHFGGGAALSYFLLDLFDSAGNFIGHIPRPIRLALVFSCVTSAAVFWEFYEFFSDHLLGTHMQFGQDDTMSDLFFGMLGCVAWLALHALWRRFRCVGKQAAAEGEAHR